MARLRRDRTTSQPDSGRLADEELMELVKGGDPEAFGIVYDRHSRAAYSLAYRMCGSGHLADDVTQEAFLSLWRAAGRYSRARGSLRTWILGIVHHRAVDTLRRHNVHDRRRAADETAAERLEAAERTDTEALRRAEARQVRLAMNDLPAEQSRVIELAYFGGFTHTEIAEMLDAPVGTVKGRMRLGLDKLRAALAVTEAAP